MHRYLAAATLLALAAPAFANDQQAANECIAAWGSQSPFKKGKKPDQIISTGVKVFGLGSSQKSDGATSGPVLVVVHPAVNVAGKHTIQLGNPNGWYCLRNQTTVAGKIAIRAHCKAHLAHTQDGGAAVLAADDTNKGVAVMGALRVERYGC